MQNALCSGSWIVHQTLVESDVGDDLRVDVLVESSHQSLPTHHKVLFKNGGMNLHIKCLVLDEDVAGVSQDSLSHHFAPRIDETMLVKGRFQSFFSEESL